jgi:uncharacterized protein (TIGR03118 family)
MKFPILSIKRLLVLGFALWLLPSAALGQHYKQTNLVSNVPVTPPAAVSDPNLQNAWGLVHGPGTPWWISNNAGGTSTLYNTSGLNPLNPANQTPPPVLLPVTIVALNAPGGTPGNGVKIPNAPSQPAPGSPTAVMFNGSPTDFLLAPGKQAIFLWVTEDGTIQGWNPGVNPTTAIIVVDRSQKPTSANGAVYKGATIIEIDGKKFILAANFRSGRIDVFDSTFRQVRLQRHEEDSDDEKEAFEDDRIPRDFAPFNVQAYGPNVYVTYAKQDGPKHDPVKPGQPGDGFVDIFSRHGRLITRLEHGDWFNAPWGVVLTPADFGEFSHTLLVGNFRGGTIAAFNPITGKFLGNVLNSDGTMLDIDGLWALGFGNGGASGPGSTLFFTAGPDNEVDGLFGTLTPIATELGEDDEH